MVRSSAHSSRLQPLGAPGRIAESACLLDRLRSRVILAGKAQHGPGHDDSRGSRCLGQGVSLVPACVVRVAAGDLHHVDTQLIEQPLELGDTPDLKAPATNTQAQGRKDWSRGRGWLRHVVFPGNRARSGSASPRRLAIGSIIACLRTRCEGLLPCHRPGPARTARRRRPIRSCGGIPGGLPSDAITRLRPDRLAS